MSTIVMSQCWPLSGFTPAEKSVLISLADNANDQGVCWPGIPLMSQRTCLSERSVQRMINQLIEKGILSVERRNGRSTIFTILVQDYLENLAQQTLLSNDQPLTERHPRQSVTPDTVSPNPRQSVTPPPTPCHPTPDTVSPRTVIEPSKEPSKEPSSLRAEFERFWDVYPRRAGSNPKKDALIKFNRNLKNGITAKNMIDAAEVYARWCYANEKTNTEFVKQAKTFLNDADAMINPENIYSPVSQIQSAAYKQNNRQQLRDSLRDVHDTSWGNSLLQNQGDSL